LKSRQWGSSSIGVLLDNINERTMGQEYLENGHYILDRKKLNTRVAAGQADVREEE
jgi:hypothetical protein